MTHKGLLKTGELETHLSKGASSILITKMEAASRSWKYFRIPVIVMSLALMIGFVGTTMYSLQMNALRDTMLLIMDILIKSAIVTTAFWSALGIHFIVTQRKATEFNTKLMLFVIAVVFGIVGAVLFGFSISQMMYHVQERNQPEIVPTLIKATIGLGLMLIGLILVGIHGFLRSRDLKVKKIAALRFDNKQNDSFEILQFNIFTNRMESATSVEPEERMSFILKKLMEQNMTRGNYKNVCKFFKKNNFYVTQFPDTPPESFNKASITLFKRLYYLGRNFNHDDQSNRSLESFFTQPQIRALFNMGPNKRIDVEIFEKDTMQLIEDIDEKKWKVIDLFPYINSPRYIVHIYDYLAKTIFSNDSLFVSIFKRLQELNGTLPRFLRETNVRESDYSNDNFRKYLRIVAQHYNYIFDQKPKVPVGNDFSDDHIINMLRYIDEQMGEDNEIESKIDNYFLEEITNSRLSPDKIIKILRTILITDDGGTHYRMDTNQNISFLIFYTYDGNKLVDKGSIFSSSGYDKDSDPLVNKDPAYELYEGEFQSAENEPIVVSILNGLEINDREIEPDIDFKYNGRCSERKMIILYTYNQIFLKRNNKTPQLTTYLYIYTDKQPCNYGCSELIPKFKKMLVLNEFTEKFGTHNIFGPYYERPDGQSRWRIQNDPMKKIWKLSMKEFFDNLP